MPAARDWHWIDHHTLDRAEIKWKPYRQNDGRHINNSGYVVLTRRGMSEADIALAEKHGLFKGSRKAVVWEHQLVAARKYGTLPPDSVVRHMNGIKTDNSPENLVLGTTQENTMDHNTARLAAMYWRERYDTLRRAVEQGLKEPDGLTGALRRALDGENSE
jgi:hypothetical protein